MSNLPNNSFLKMNRYSSHNVRFIASTILLCVLAIFYSDFTFAQNVEQANPSQELNGIALEFASEYIESRGDEIAVQLINSEIVPSTGETIFQFEAIGNKSPNEPSHTFVLDRLGRQVDLEALNGREGKEFFAIPKFSAVAASAAMPAAIRASAATSSGIITIDPDVNNHTFNQGDTFDEVITVNIPGEATIPLVDVYFLADSTGSMGSIIAAVQNDAAGIMNQLIANLPTSDLVFGVGNYKDFPIGLGGNTHGFQHQLNLTSDTTSVINNIDNWAASGGSDAPEGQLFALDQLAEPPGGTIGWRAGSERVIVWFGDQPGHDPICQAISGLSFDITEASVTAKLIDEQITVLALSTTSALGLDGDPASGAGDYNGICTIGGASGQATRITNSTGGTHVPNTGTGTVVTTIINLITTAVNTFNNVSLVPTGGTAPFVASISPDDGFGPLTSDVDHVLPFDVRFLSTEPCADVTQVFTGTIDAVIDGAVVAAKQVTIKVPGCPKGGINGIKFHDVNRDGVKDYDEPGLAEWEIVATDSDGNSTATTTDADGNYQLELSPGTYTVVETQQEGWTQTYPTTISYTVTIEPGETAENIDFGNVQSCTDPFAIETTGAIFTTTPPDDVNKDVNESNDIIVFNEVHNFVLPSDVDVNITTNGAYRDDSSLTPGTLSAGTTVNSYLIRFDPKKVRTARATIKFSSKILGVIIKANWLKRSQLLGHPDVSYPVDTLPGGIEFTDDWISVNADMQTLNIYMKSYSPGDNVRVITEMDCEVDPTLCSDIETTNVTFLSTPPSNVSPNMNENDNFIVFEEVQGFSIPHSGVAVDITTDGTYNSTAGLTPAVLTGDMAVRSYLVRFDPSKVNNATGTVKFSEKIVGIIVKSQLLDSSDLLGHPSVIYPESGVKLRGLEIDKADSIKLHSDMQTIEMTQRANSPGDHIRVITEATCVDPPPPPPQSDALYFSSSTGGKVSGVSFADEDILAFDPITERWAMYFDGSDLDLKSQDVNAFHILDDGNILMSFNTPKTIAGVEYDDSDIVRFDATSLGTTTAGSFSMYLDGSDVYLTTGGEDIDAIGFTADGDLVISTLGRAKVGFTAQDEDLIRFEGTSFGSSTSGTWYRYFDGSDVAMTAGSEDIWATWIDKDTDEIHLSTQKNYYVSSSGTSLNGDGDDVFICAPVSLGKDTQCNLSLFWNGDDHGYGKESIDGYAVGPMATGMIFSASVARHNDIAEDITDDIAEENDTANDDVLEEEDITTRLYLPLINQ